MLLKKIIGCVILILLGIEFTHNISSVFDLGTYDEISYLWNGIYLNKEAAFEWSIYSLQYYLLSQIIHNKLNLYYISQQISITLLPVLFFILLSTTIKHRYALVTSLLLLYMDSNISAFTKVNHFSNIMLLLGGALIIWRSRSFQFKSVAATITLMAVSYVRAEYLLPFFLSLTLLSGYSILQYALFKSRLTLAIAISLIAFTVVTSLYGGTPLTGNRSIFSFKQMYSNNYQAWNNLNIEIPDEEAIAMEVFGPVNTIGEAIESNPQEVWRHITFNTEKVAELIIWKSVDFTTTRSLYPGRSDLSFDHFFERLGLMLGLLAVGLLLIKRRETKSPNLNSIWYLYSLLIIGIGLAISLFFFADERYLTTIWLFIYGNIIFFAARRFQFRYPVFQWALPLVLFLIIVINRPELRYYYQGPLIYQQVFTEYEKIDFVYGDTMLVPYQFLGLFYVPVGLVLYDGSTGTQYLSSPNAKAVLTCDSLFNTQVPNTSQYSRTYINDTLNLYVKEN